MADEKVDAMNSLASDGYFVGEFNKRVKEKMESDGMTRRAASIAVAKADPALHRRFTMANNPGRAQRAALAGK